MYCGSWIICSNVSWSEVDYALAFRCENACGRTEVSIQNKHSRRLVWAGDSQTIQEVLGLAESCNNDVILYFHWHPIITFSVSVTGLFIYGHGSGFRWSASMNRPPSRLLAIGNSSWVLLQCVCNVCVCFFNCCITFGFYCSTQLNLRMPNSVVLLLHSVQIRDSIIPMDLQSKGAEMAVPLRDATL